MNRKEMVLKLCEFLGESHKYLAAPSFAYQIETDNETYTIDRQGAITTAEGREMTLEEIMNQQHHQVDEGTELAVEAIEVALPLEGHTGTTLQNLINMLYSKQHLIMMAFKTEAAFMDEFFAQELSTKETSTLESIKGGIDELGTQRCPGIILNPEQGTIIIKLIAPCLTPEKTKAFADLVGLANESAKNQKRASFRQAQDDNPKFALRTWATRLGMIGTEYQATRKALMANLEGSSSYRKVVGKDE